MDVSRKSVGVLIDELITTSMKCWHAQERVMHGKSDKEIAIAAKTAQQMNSKRNKLIRAIDKRLGDAALSPTAKTYS